MSWKRENPQAEEEEDEGKLGRKGILLLLEGFTLVVFLLGMIKDSGKKVKIAGSRQVTQMTDRLLTN